ncbi:MAG: tocopherol cyclase family protein, partial [Spirochaetota bacterium]
MIQQLSALFNPENYHGWRKTKRFFEGWYFKILDRTGQHPYAFIPGVAMDETGKRHSFIQVLDGAALRAEYHSFDFDAFAA